jgi:regulatory protein
MSPYKKKRKPIYDVNSGVPPTDEENEKMERQAKNVTEYWLGQSDRSRKANKVLNYYEERDYINDERFANQFVHSKTTYEKLGKRAIAFKLREKGVDADLIASAIDEIDEENEEEQARELALRKARSNRRYEYQKRVQQIAGLLSRRGYSGSLIFRLAKEAIEEIDAEFAED